MKNLRSWKWKAADLTGKIYRGTWDYAEAAEVRRGLKQRGLYPFEIRPRLDLRFVLELRQAQVKWIHLMRNLSLLLDAGLPLLQALDILAHRSPNRRNHSPHQLQIVKQKIEEGLEFSEAITVLRPIPNSFIRYCIRAAEQNGTLVRGLKEIASSLETDLEFKKKIKTALAYPAVLLVMTIVILTTLSLWLLPMYESLFNSFNSQLPLLTQVIFSVGKYLPLIIILFLIASCGLLTLIVLIPKVKIWFASRLRRLPVCGSILRLGDEEQFCRILAQMLGAGIPILDALKLLRDPEYNVGVNVLVENLIVAVNEGRKLAPVVKMSGVVSAERAELFHIGEEAGKLEEALLLISRWARLDLEEKLAETARILEPLLIVGMAGLIGMIAIGVLLPVLQASAYVY